MEKENEESPLVPSPRALATRRGVLHRPSRLISSPKPCKRTLTASSMPKISEFSSRCTPFSSSRLQWHSSKTPIDSQWWCIKSIPQLKSQYQGSKHTPKAQKFYPMLWDRRKRKTNFRFSQIHTIFGSQKTKWHTKTEKIVTNLTTTRRKKSGCEIATDSVWN